MNITQALFAGVVGGAVMSMILGLARTMGMQVDVELMLGTLLGEPPSVAIRMIGLIVHLVISGLIALLYAAGFEYVMQRAGWRVGLAFSLVHLLIAGIFLGVIPALHPLVPEVMPAPGAFMANLGILGIGAFVLLHLLYGAIVGTMYEPVHVPAEGGRVGRIAAAPGWDAESSDEVDTRQ